MMRDASPAMVRTSAIALVVIVGTVALAIWLSLSVGG